MQDQGLDCEKCLWLCSAQAASMAGCHSGATPKINKNQKKSVVYTLHMLL